MAITKGLKGHISRESWSRCEQSSMLYDTIRNPNVLNMPLKPAIKTESIDTLESSCESSEKQLKSQVLNRFNSVGLQLPHESFIAVVQVGKYVFLAIMLPPYLLLYGLPRWFLVNIVPFVFLESKAAFIAIGKMISKRSAFVKDLMKGILDQLLGDALKIAKDKMRKVNDFFRKIGEGIKTHFFGRIVKNVQQLKSLQDELRQAVSIRVKRGIDRIKGPMQTVLNHLPAFFAPVKSLSQTILKWTKLARLKIIAPIANVLFSNYKSVKDGVRATFTKGKEKIKSIKDRLKATLKSFASEVNNARKKTWQKAKSLIDQATSKLLEHLQQVKDFSLDICKTVFHPLLFIGNSLLSRMNQFPRFKRFAKKAFTPVAFGLKKSFDGFNRGLKAVFSHISRKTQELGQKILGKKDKIKLRFLRLIEQIGRLFSFFRRACKAVIKVFLGLFFAALKASQAVWTVILHLPKGTYRFSLWLWKYLRKILSRFSLILRFTVAVIWAVGYVGYYFLREFSRH